MATQNAMNKGEKNMFFDIWEKASPKDPQKGWFGLLSTDDAAGIVSCPIEDYDTDGDIVQIGAGLVDRSTGVYLERIDTL